MCLLDVTIPNRVMGIYLGCLVTRAKKTSRGLQYVGSSILLHFIGGDVPIPTVIGDPPPCCVLCTMNRSRERCSSTSIDQGRALKKGFYGAIAQRLERPPVSRNVWGSNPHSLALFIHHWRTV